MNNRPTIALACILKNEVKNLPRLLASVEGCFDEIHLTDTGSTDGSVELIAKYAAGENPADTPVFLHHFPWCDDFAAARNASFEPVKTDYVMWMDLDDVLSDRENFILWRDEILKIANFWFATYHYALSPEGQPICSFARERVFKTGIGLKWRYFIHEGVIPTDSTAPIATQYAMTWSVNHMRSQEDLQADRSRNLTLFEKNKGSLDARMRYYYGKELFEHGKPLDAFTELVTACADPKLELHDRIMAFQYACFAAMAMGQIEKAIALAHQGLQLAPTRAEFHVILGDCYAKHGKLLESLPFYEAATGCQHNADSRIQGAIFQHGDYYRHYPLNQMARIYATMGALEKSEAYIARALKMGAHPETAAIAKEVEEVRQKIGQPAAQRTKTRDIVISCHPQNMYEWDEGVYREKGIGGSETACVEMAQWLSKKTGREVLVFNNRPEKKSFGGVHYIPSHEVPQYFAHHSPALHIAWRHAVRFSEDPMYIWCHDLAFQGIETSTAYHKVLALSPFHKRFLRSMYGVSEDKILVTRNGIDPNRFQHHTKKTFGKIVYSSSPDRGLDRTIRVMDEVVKSYPEATLHVYYGFDGMRKLGRDEEVRKLEAMIAARPYIHFHGNITQEKLTQELAQACIWLYPTDFLETFCITALEAISSNCYPIVRAWGALPDTLAAAAAEGQAALVDRDCVSPDDVAHWSSLVVGALMNQSWARMTPVPQRYSWESVADEWIQMFNLGE